MSKHHAETETESSLQRPPTRRRTHTTSHAGATTLQDPLLMERVLGFVSTPRGDCWARTHHATQFIRTVASVCLALSPNSAASLSLSERFGPRNRALWCEMLFRHFDFSVLPGSDAINSYNENDLDIGGHPATRRHAQLLAQYEDELEHGLHVPPTDADGEPFLAEDFSYWQDLHVCFRPSQYGSLCNIQAGKQSIYSFPADVDPCELFHDLAVLVDDLRIHSARVSTRTGKIKPRDLYPMLLDCNATKITLLGSSLLEMTGIAPTFWDATLMVSATRPGLPREHHRRIRDAAYEPDVDPEELAGGKSDTLEPAYFGEWKRRRAVKDAVRKRLADWRHVRTTNNQGPQFYVGKRPRTHRWIGFLRP